MRNFIKTSHTCSFNVSDNSSSASLSIADLSLVFEKVSYDAKGINAISTVNRNSGEILQMG